ncbi:hypothetical protein [Methylorubrum populi]|uniref:Uncharacterized protein n=1 Tax=Methylorubrum populi TaxID=223967 RepID=A0A833J1G8_9HYPH|nr:hypothetical protein [Methylorubrum populi]KAB7782873.1 hypothetical protein F8B43_4167 [Methylorubrum populi]
MATPPNYVDASAIGESPSGSGIPSGTPANLANAYVTLHVADPNNLTPNGHKGAYMRLSDLVAYIVATAKGQ